LAISSPGPLGTMVGLYETASMRFVAVKSTRPDETRKRSGLKWSLPPPRSRRGRTQIKALFRNGVEIFRALVRRRYSYFAVTVPAEEKPGRLYAGVARQGRSRR